MSAPAFTPEEAAREISKLAQRILELAAIAGLYVGIKIEPARGESPSTQGADDVK